MTPSQGWGYHISSTFCLSYWEVVTLYPDPDSDWKGPSTMAPRTTTTKDSSPAVPLLSPTGVGQPTFVLGTDRTLSDVARATGMSLSHVSRIFSGHRTPTVKALRDIATFLGIGTGELLEILEKQVAQHEAA